MLQAVVRDVIGNGRRCYSQRLGVLKATVRGVKGNGRLPITVF